MPQNYFKLSVNTLNDVFFLKIVNISRFYYLRTFKEADIKAYMTILDNPNDV